jgi:eukaryotic-like serine/threonine-protein kinase
VQESWAFGMASSRVYARAEAGRGAHDAPRELRNYRLLEQTGQEELTTVFRGMHLSLGRPVQIHVLRRSDWVSASRFQLAAQLAAQFSHPNLLPVIDAGQDDYYGEYIVTPLIEARSLASLLEAGPLDPVLALRIAGQMAEVLDYLHAEQIVHRDVQPANILVSSQGLAYLSNLSLAAGPDTPDLSSVQEADYLTPYSAPEQRLDQRDASVALDIYGLGATIYHMLSGEPPPGAGVELPSVARHDAALSSADRVLARMMDAQPAARFPSADAAVSALRQSLRTQIDLATDDMEESRWETSAEWLENPLETALSGAMSDELREFVARSRKRADELHRREAIRRLLNRWSRGGFFRRPMLGQMVQPEQIVSYNLYFYDLRTQYETRTAPQPRRRAPQADERNSTLPVVPVWDAPVPETPPFEPVRPQELVLPNSIQLRTCPECQGARELVCPNCSGQGTVQRERKVRNPDGSRSSELITGECHICRGYGKQPCPTCAGSGSLLEEQVFRWSRRARLWQNTDDLDDLPAAALEQRAERIHGGDIQVYEGTWHSVAPLSELLRTAINDAGEDTRLVAAELSIRGVPITEFDYALNDKPGRLYLIGFDNQLYGDWSLFNPERIALVAIAVALALIALIALLIWML